MRIEHLLGGSSLLLVLLAGNAMAASQDDNVEWDGILSDTTSTFASPSEVDAGETLVLKLRAKANDLTGVVCRVWLSGPNQEQRLSMSRSATANGFDYWTVSLPVPTNATHVYYRFEVTDGSDLDYYDAGAPGDTWNVRGMSDDYRGDDYNFKIVVGYHTPDWSKDAVFYQIFPDRFYDGNKTNNKLFPEDCYWYLDYAPALPDDSACDSYTVPTPDADWTKFCEIHDSWNETPNQGPCDFFGGDLQGVEAKLSYVESLGASAIYLNPIFRSPSNHKYDTMDYEEVDPRFGGTTALGSLTAASSRDGMKIVLDGVFNHTSDLGLLYNGWANYAFDDGNASGYDWYPTSCGAWETAFLNSQANNWTDCQSDYSDWFKVWIGTDTWDVDRDGNTSEPAAHNCGWDGFEFMPDIDYKSPSQANSEARVWLYGGSSATNLTQAKQSIAGMWLANGEVVSRGVDGWRLDVPDNAGYFSNSTAQDCSKIDNDLTIWEGFHKATKTVGSDKYIVGEIWGDATDNAGKNYSEGVFDGVMDYHFFGIPISCFITGVGMHNDAGECTGDYAGMKLSSSTLVSSLDAHIAKQRWEYPASFYQSSLNLLSSHDTARFASRAGGDLEKVKEAMFFLATLPGAPMVYYGDELGVEGANNELGRAPFPWTALNSPSSQEMQVHDLVANLMCIRNSYPALRTGSFVTLAVSNSQKTYGYGRFDSTDRIAVAINNDGASHMVSLAMSRMGIADGTTLVDLLNDQTYVVASGSVNVNVARNSGILLVTEDRASVAQACFDGPITPNDPPVADAGPDITVTTSDLVVLDGSGSSDPNGDTLTYVWMDGYGNQVGTEAVVEVGPISEEGAYTYTLTVSDGEYSDSDVLKITVNDTLPPTCQPSSRMVAPGDVSLGLMPLILSGLALLGIRRRRGR